MKSLLHCSKASYVEKTYHCLQKDLGMLDYWLLTNTDLQRIQYQNRKILVTNRHDNRFTVINLQQNQSYYCQNTCSIQACSGSWKTWIIMSYRGMSALKLSNHYFTSCKEGSELVLSTDIDPYRYLVHAVGTTLLYWGECCPILWKARE